MTRLLALIVFSCSLFLVSAPAHGQIGGANVPEPEDFISPGAEPDLEYELEFDEIETDRDSFTPATTLAGAGRWVFEAAYSFVDNPRVLESHSFPELLVRYGAADWLELRLGWNYEVGGAETDISSAAGEGREFSAGSLETAARLLYGVKLALSEQRGWRPRSALILQGFTPTAGVDDSSTVLGAYVAGWTLPNRWQFDGAMRYSVSSAEGDRFGVWAPSVVVKFPVGERWKAHLEYFGLFSAGSADNFSRSYISPGAHYLITENLEIGARVGWGLNPEAARFFCNAGVGWRY